MESKAKRGPRQPENCMPNTIVIQLVSAQPQAMPISVHATPLLPGPKTPVEQPRRPPPPPAFPNRSKSPIAPYPTRLQSTMCSSLRRRTQLDEVRYSPPQSTIDCTNQPLGQGRTVWMEYVYHPKENVAPSIYIPPPIANLNDTGGHYTCNNCCCVRRSIPEPENFMENHNQTLPQPSDIPQWRRESGTTEGRRDQATNTDEQPQHMEVLKAICETLGQAIVTAARASVEGAQTIDLSDDSSPNYRSFLAHTMGQMMADSKKTGCQEGLTNTLEMMADTRNTVGHEDTANTSIVKPKTDFASSIQLLGATPSTSKQKTNLVSPKLNSVIYPKTPRGTMASGLEVPIQRDLDLDNRMESGVECSSEIYIKSPNYIAGGMSVRKFPKAKQPSTSFMGRIGPAVRRRFPTEELPLVKYEKTYCPKSPNAAMPLTKQTEILEPSTPEQTVVTLPPVPDLCSYSQTDDPCLANKI